MTRKGSKEIFSNKSIYLQVSDVTQAMAREYRLIWNWALQNEESFVSPSSQKEMDFD